MASDQIHRSERRAASTRARRLAAAAAAGSFAVLFAAGAAGAAPDGATDRAEPAGAVDWETVKITSGGPRITLDGHAKVFRTGAVKGEVDLGLPAGGDHAEAANLFLHKVKGSKGDFGDVDVLIGPDLPVEGARCGADPVIEFASGVAIDVAKLPGGLAESGGDPIPLATDPFVLEPVEIQGTESFPPVNQVYKLEDSVSLYLEAGDGDFEKIGVLEAFTVTVNRS